MAELASSQRDIAMSAYEDTKSSTILKPGVLLSYAVFLPSVMHEI